DTAKCHCWEHRDHANWVKGCEGPVPLQGEASRKVNCRSVTDCRWISFTPDKNWSPLKAGAANCSPCRPTCSDTESPTVPRGLGPEGEGR
ncbi:MAG: hypothetical protein ABT940_13925, partial [Alphaproteobacteria bacterium]